MASPLIRKKGGTTLLISSAIARTGVGETTQALVPF
jgi:hypothetical protein